jgi:hypothetical protein
MDKLVFSGIVRLEGVPQVRSFNRETCEPVAFSPTVCAVRLRNLRARGDDGVETARAVEAWPHGDA